MKIITGKIIGGAALAISLGVFTIPAGASVAPLIHTNTIIKPVPGIQIAQVARDVDQKTDEMRDGATGAVDAVDAAHRQHERNEYRHHTIAGKVDSKIDEATTRPWVRPTQSSALTNSMKQSSTPKVATSTLNQNS